MSDTELVQPLRSKYIAVVVTSKEHNQYPPKICPFSVAGCECFKASSLLCNENGHGHWANVSAFSAIVGTFKSEAYICNEDGTMWKNSHGYPILKKGRWGDDNTSVRNRMWNFMDDNLRMWNAKQHKVDSSKYRFTITGCPTAACPGEVDRCVVLNTTLSPSLAFKNNADDESHDTATSPLPVLQDELPLPHDDFDWADEAEELEQEALLRRSNAQPLLVPSKLKDESFLEQDDFDWADEAEELEYAALLGTSLVPALPNRA